MLQRNVTLKHPVFQYKIDLQITNVISIGYNLTRGNTDWHLNCYLKVLVPYNPLEAELLEAIKLDLSEIDWPMCLLEFNKTLEEAKSGSELEVWIKDPDVMQTINIIIANSSNRMVTIKKEDDRFRIWIHKA